MELASYVICGEECITAPIELDCNVDLGEQVISMANRRGIGTCWAYLGRY